MNDFQKLRYEIGKLRIALGVSLMPKKIHNKVLRFALVTHAQETLKERP